MAKCPRCGVEVANPRKFWKMAGRPDKRGKRTELIIELFDCPKCKKSFRKVLSKRKGPIEHPESGPIIRRRGSRSRPRPRPSPREGPIEDPDGGPIPPPPYG